MNSKAGTLENSVPVVLVVDDDQVARLLMRQTMEKAGFSVIEAANGVDALELFDAVDSDAVQPDIMLLDIGMPGMDGYEVCEELRKRPKARYFPILMVTGYEDTDSVNRAYDVGATDFICKPVNWALLPHRVRYLIRNAQAVRQLDLSEIRLAEAQRIAHLGSWQWDIGTGVIYWSDETYRIFNLQPGEIEPDYQTFLDFVHPKDRSSVEHAMQQALETKGTYNVEHRIVDAQGQERIVREYGQINLNDAGEPLSMIGSVHDVTEQRQIEQQLIQSQKMEAMGTLVGGIAHEFNNMLAGITANLYLIKKRMQGQPDTCKRVESIELLAFRASEMIRQLLMFARKNSIEKKRVMLPYLLRESINLNRAAIPKNIDLNYDFAEGSMVVHGDEAQIQQMLLNLLNNAKDALEGVSSPQIQVSLQRFEPDDLFYKRNPEVAAGSFARLSVKDNGAGITPENISRVMEPYFTTKVAGKGTGLGLPMVYGVVQSHQGALQIESSQEEGTSIHILLPLMKSLKNASEQTDDPEPVIAKADGETLLLVDDDEEILHATSEVLRSLGYQVLVSSDREKALELFSSHPVSLVIMDIVMPKMNGADLLKEIRESDPTIPAIFSTGYDKDEAVLNAGLEQENTVVLNKPMRIEDLSWQIRTMI